MNRPTIISFFVTLLFAAGVASGQSVVKNDPEPTESQERANSCAIARSTLLNFVVWSRDRQRFHEVPIWQLPDSQAFFFVSGMTIDADGAPNAYDPDDTGLDDIANAGGPAHWDGIITDREGNLLVQGESDPFPGYYISCTSLSDQSKKLTDPTRYVDASKIPYVVLPNDLAERAGARLGDFAVVMNLRNGKSSYAIYADIGTMGEGSIALADKLGIWSDARRGGQSDGILYLVFPGSGNLEPRTIDEIQSEAEKLLHDWGGIEKLASCGENHNPADTTVPRQRLFISPVNQLRENSSFDSSMPPISSSNISSEIGDRRKIPHFLTTRKSLFASPLRVSPAAENSGNNEDSKSSHVHASALSFAGAEIKSETDSGFRSPRVSMELIRPSSVYVRKPIGCLPHELRNSPLAVVIVADSNFHVPTSDLLDCAGPPERAVTETNSKARIHFDIEVSLFLRAAASANSNIKPSE
jgi:Fungal chitosanase of glycosyl hydrolase group 75